MIALRVVNLPLKVRMMTIELMFHLESGFQSSQTFHIDLWTGSNTRGGGDKQTSCENTLPGGEVMVVRDPPGGLDVDGMSPLSLKLLGG